MMNLGFFQFLKDLNKLQFLEIGREGAPEVEAGIVIVVDGVEARVKSVDAIGIAIMKRIQRRRILTGYF